MQKNILQQIRNLVEFTDADAEVLNRFSVARNYKKKEFILKEGKACNSLFYVEKGCVRMYFINQKGVEQITQFALEGWWISDYTSFMNGTASLYAIQAVEDSKIVTFSQQDLEDLFGEVPKMERYFRIIMQKAVAAAQVRSKLLYEMSKEEFFIHFSTSFPEFMRRVPQYMIASYLGLSPEYLSELRKKTIL